jgi:hypothetical protein
MQRFAMPKPTTWGEAHRFKIGRLRKLMLSTIIESETGKAYVGIVLGTEGGITVGYQRHRAITELRLVVGMRTGLGSPNSLNCVAWVLPGAYPLTSRDTRKCGKN